MQSRRKVVLDRAATRCSETQSTDGGPRQGAKASFDGRNVCQKCFCVTFDESKDVYKRQVFVLGNAAQILQAVPGGKGCKIFRIVV